MDQVKIGKFIAECRKENNLTQMQLAEKLNITNRAVSKWETGKALPDSAIMMELCDLLHITVNDLMCGERITEGALDKKYQEQILELIRQKEQSDRQLHKALILVWIVFMCCGIVGILISAYAPLNCWHDIMTAVFLVLMVLCGLVGINLEKNVGYYQCQECQHTYVPSYRQLFRANGFWKKQMRCPHCKKKTWHKKVFSKK